MNVGIEGLGVYGGRAVLDVGTLAQARGLDGARFANLLMKRKTVALNFEDPVSFAVNAARPLIEALPAGRRAGVELVVVATESGIDFGKPISTYVHHHLGLGPNCRSFEVKHACYGGTASLQMAVATVRTSRRPDPLALVITTDVARPLPHTYAEPSQGAAAVAMLVGRQPELLRLEEGASGFFGYEVMDSCRPTAEIETGDADLSLLTYLECIEQSFRDYQRQMGEVDFQAHFDYLALHTPFGGMAKGAHRTMMRKLKRLPPDQIEADFQRRLEPSLVHCQQVGNIYSGTVYLALAGLLGGVPLAGGKRIGLFSYGSGCCSEFFSGIADERSRAAIERADVGGQLADRHLLDMETYERLIALNRSGLFGVRNVVVDRRPMAEIYERQFAGRGLLVLTEVADYHREYQWS